MTSLDRRGLRAACASLAGGTAMAVAMIVGASPAAAQDAAAPDSGTPAAAASDQPGDIIVTAQKRRENVQDVPAAVQVIGEAQMQASGVRSFADLTKIAPSLIARPAEQPVNSSISIRGIGTFAFSINVEPSVAVQVDDVPVAFQARAFTNLADIERIEVLRGPQSTLYGKSASAGIVNIVRQGPTDTLTADVGALATSDREYQWNMAVSGPLADTVTARVTGLWNRFSGNVRNLQDGRRVNGREALALGGKLRWEPVSALWVEAALDYTDGSTSLGQPLIALSPNARLQGVAALSPAVFAAGLTPGPDNTRVLNNFPGGTDYRDVQQAVRMGLDVGWASVMSITSHDRYTMQDRLDQDNTAQTLVDTRQTGTIEATQWTQELRLVSDGRRPLRYTLGLFYADVDARQVRDRGPVYAISHYTATSGSLQKAVFGQIEYDLLPALTAIGGMRYGSDKASYTFLNRVNGTAFAGSDSRRYTTYKASLRYALTPAVNVYATYATGRKGQAYDLSTGFNAVRAAAGPVLPETSRSWEAGLRSQFLDRKLTVNVTAFTADYDNFQAQGIETLPDGSTSFRLANVGAIRTRGIEFETLLRPTRSLSISGSAAYLDAEITNFPLAQCYPGQTAAQGCTGSPSRQNLTGRRPPQAPAWKGTANIDYAYPLAGRSLAIASTAAYSYQSRINFALSQDPQAVQPGYGILNLALGLRATDRHWEVMGFVNNVTDKRYVANVTNMYGTFNNQLATNALLPRDFRRYGGIRFAHSF